MIELLLDISVLLDKYSPAPFDILINSHVLKFTYEMKLL